MIQTTTGRYYSELSTQPLVAQLQQLTQLTWDGDLIGKKETKELHEDGYVTRFDGWNIITPNGVVLLEMLGFIAP